MKAAIDLRPFKNKASATRWLRAASTTGKTFMVGEVAGCWEPVRATYLPLPLQGLRLGTCASCFGPFGARGLKLVSSPALPAYASGVSEMRGDV